jgi:hypothetical protein
MFLTGFHIFLDGDALSYIFKNTKNIDDGEVIFVRATDFNTKIIMAKGRTSRPLGKVRLDSHDFGYLNRCQLISYRVTWWMNGGRFFVFTVTEIVEGQVPVGTNVDKVIRVSKLLLSNASFKRHRDVEQCVFKW